MMKPIPGDKATYDPSRNDMVYGDINYGHKQGKSWKGNQDAPENQNKGRSDIIKDQNDPDIYQIEWSIDNSTNGGKKKL